MKNLAEKTLLCVAAFIAPSVAAAKDIVSPMLPEEVLVRGDRMFSENGQYRLDFQSDGNLVLYRTSNGVALWSSNTHGTPVTMLRFGELYTGSVGCYPEVEAHSTQLFLTEGADNTWPYHWCVSGTREAFYPEGPTRLILQDDGGLYLWQVPIGAFKKIN
ncbi:hypothetical protein [Luteimonas salinilitoris]|uniref:Bulb-type lectin domain-containing protein n=1 Tax=Luteimonas salinilitoris TaxID=3237697 RepID=A0ABV4HKT3_9GAMM